MDSAIRPCVFTKTGPNNRNRRWTDASRSRHHGEGRSSARRPSTFNLRGRDVVGRYARVADTGWGAVQENAEVCYVVGANFSYLPDPLPIPV